MTKFPFRVFSYFARRGVFNWLPDTAYLKILYKGRFDKKLDLNNPKTFNEKLQWLKLHDRQAAYPTMVDKYEAKIYVAEKIGSEYIVPTIGVWDKFEDIDFSSFPDKFVLKCTHDSGGIVICKDKSKLNIEEARKKINKSLRQNYYWSGREWPYKEVKQRIIAEKYLEIDADNDVIDYKVHCFNGVPEMILVCKDRFAKTGMTEDFYDVKWNHLQISRLKHGNSQTLISKPLMLDLMLNFAAQLSKDIPFSRIDFYEVNEKLFFGEITFFPASGFERFNPDTVDLQLGDRIHLPKVK